MEGIFRINAENGQEVYVRDQLNRGIVPHGIDLHCLAGLIKVTIIFQNFVILSIMFFEYSSWSIFFLLYN